MALPSCEGCDAAQLGEGIPHSHTEGVGRELNDWTCGRDTGFRGDARDGNMETLRRNSLPGRSKAHGSAGSLLQMGTGPSVLDQPVSTLFPDGDTDTLNVSIAHQREFGVKELYF